MKRIFSALTVMMAALLVTACTKCSQDKPVEPPPAVEAPQDPPAVDGAIPGDVSAVAPGASDEAAPAK